eukprot:3405833-Prymnesium_polylepis.1
MFGLTGRRALVCAGWYRGVQDHQLVRKRAGFVAEHGGLGEGNGGGDGSGVVAVERPRRGARDA